VRVSASLETNHFVLRVADSGFGIPKAEVQSIWDKFHRVASTQGRSIEGAGIGLALTFELVKLHKGDVHVESEPGQGRFVAPRVAVTATLTRAQHVPRPVPDRQYAPAFGQSRRRGPGGLCQPRARRRRAHD
jgi:signal transduction histidine kinase